MMNRFILSISISIILIACTENKTPEKVSTTVFDSSYKPPVFTHGSRMEKIMQAFPVIDKIFKEYADTNHFPGVAYGIVVDGKLVYKEQLWLYRY